MQFDFSLLVTVISICVLYSDNIRDVSDDFYDLTKSI